jgi:hypothetical protein
MGFAEIHLHQVARDQRGFIEAFGQHVLPALRRDFGQQSSVHEEPAERSRLGGHD